MHGHDVTSLVTLIWHWPCLEATVQMLTLFKIRESIRQDKISLNVLKFAAYQYV